MSNNTTKQESRTETIKNEATRQRWELFHQAIAHAKQSNVADLEEYNRNDNSALRPEPLQSVGS